jgi:hypothetical protein
MSANKNPQQSDSKSSDGSQSDRSNPSGRQGEQSTASRGQQFEGVRDASRGKDTDTSESGSQDVETILDRIEENFRSLRQAIGSGRSDDRSQSADGSRAGAGQTLSKGGGRSTGQGADSNASQYGADAGGKMGGQSATGKTSSTGSDKGQQSGGQGAGRSGGQTGR